MAFHYRRLGQNMRRIRLSANMTQRAVAEALGYANPRKALDDHVDPEDKMQGDGGNNS